ncbi:BTAD domain-containing putative transcriptional regulator [Umezawaea sp. Da 62-37]|uniref:BTAD domain-containing putative transcriptional regulator n=1 Tax=Umezawaea sp. Da 62-37 TaxID=3075927 RepID=UPI0028F71C2A|nr:BTAD domain-containing putative transcriptional regulator [Umezawaea sp. Da 62-37]WNV87316.1 BTAD domain-containing putative transcriptional regulator [Umezawaea sp. Da 62-37]
MTSVDLSLEVALLGEPAAWHDGRRIHLGGGLKRAVFAALALRANHSVSRTELIDAVWGPEAPASAAGGLYTYISALRRALGPTTALTTSYAGYQLELRQDALDVHRLDHLREQARVLNEAGDTDRELAVLGEALALWNGEALSGVPGPLAEATRLRLKEIRLSVLERRAELLVATDRHDEVIDELVDLVRANPAREGLHGLLMTSMFRAGRQTDALEAYRRARDVLVDRFGTEPGHALRSLHQRILAGDTTVGRTSDLAGSRQALRIAARTRASTPFVGRAEPVARLRSAVADVLAGRGGCVWVEGAPGSGKSALLAEALAGTTSASCTVSWTGADEFTQDIPFYTVERCLGDIGAALPHVPPVHLSLGPDTPVSSVLDHVRQVVGSHVGQPLVMVLDDLQWADVESLSVWHYLRGLSQHRPLLMVSACRPLPGRHDLDLMRELADGFRSTTVPLPPMTDHEARDLLERVQPLARTSARTIVALAGGNPAYLLAMAAAVEHHGQVRKWKAVPHPVAAVVLDHFGHLTVEAREVLRAMALLGDSCSVEEIMATTGARADDLVDVLAEALEVGALVESDDEVRFAHPLLRRVLYESVPVSLRLAVHQQCP